MIPCGDGANWAFGNRDTRAADRDHPDHEGVSPLRNLESIASEIRVTGSIRRGFTPRSTYTASCRRKNKFSALIDCVERNVSRNGLKIRVSLVRFRPWPPSDQTSI